MECAGKGGLQEKAASGIPLEKIREMHYAQGMEKLSGALGIMADSHGKNTLLLNAVGTLRSLGAGTLIHLGDLCDSLLPQTAAPALGILDENDVQAVRGNNECAILHDRGLRPATGPGTIPFPLSEDCLLLLQGPFPLHPLLALCIPGRHQEARIRIPPRPRVRPVGTLLDPVQGALPTGPRSSRSMAGHISRSPSGKTATPSWKGPGGTSSRSGPWSLTWRSCSNRSSTGSGS